MRLMLLALMAGLAVTPLMAETTAQTRKARSEAVLQAAGVPILPSLPLIEDEVSSLRRTDAEVAKRAIALAIVAVKGETGDHTMGLGLIDQFEAKDFFTPDESAFMADPNPTEQDRVKFSWRYEAVWLLLWSLNIIEDIGPPSDIADVPRLVEILRELGTDGVLAKAKLRPQSEILDAADLIYRQDWAVVNADLDGAAAPVGLDPDVVQERHYTLNWLIGYAGQAWDEISTDT